MELPRKVAVGSGVILELPEICADLKLAPRVLIVTGPNTQDVVGKAIFDLLNGWWLSARDLGLQRLPDGRSGSRRKAGAGD